MLRWAKTFRFTDGEDALAVGTTEKVVAHDRRLLSSVEALGGIAGLGDLPLKISSTAS
jgi:hypothetical protein